MDCNEATPLFALGIDRELDDSRETRLIAHLNNCPTCSVAHSRAHSARNALRAALTHHRLSAAGQERLWQAFPGEEAASLSASPARRPHRAAANIVARWFATASRSALRPWATVAAACVLTAVATYTLKMSGNPAPPDLAIVSAHVRAIGEGPLTLVSSSDRHTVKPWFAGKLSFAPRVPDLTDESFLLIGGRVDQLGAERVAALVYRRRQHIVQVFRMAGRFERGRRGRIFFRSHRSWLQLHHVAAWRSRLHRCFGSECG